MFQRIFGEDIESNTSALGTYTAVQAGTYGTYGTVGTYGRYRRYLVP